ncbi:MAG TPA: CBS domain-containing protein [Terriglobales bacterium]|nr:CBS domain-containing protein [Terriglobales bacterium]
MLVSDYMTTSVTTLPDDGKLLDAALLIRRTGKRHVPIVSVETGKVVGIISDRDVSRLAPSILSKQSQEEYNDVFEKTPITMAMTKNPLTISPSAPIAEAAQLLYTKKIGALLAVEDGELKGILSVSDMLGLLNELLAGNRSTDASTGM